MFVEGYLLKLAGGTLEGTLYHQNIKSIIKSFEESGRLERQYINVSPFVHNDNSIFI